jgi:hypothetical protein
MRQGKFGQIRFVPAAAISRRYFGASMAVWRRPPANRNFARQSIEYRRVFRLK